MSKAAIQCKQTAVECKKTTEDNRQVRRAPSQNNNIFKTVLKFKKDANIPTEANSVNKQNPTKKSNQLNQHKQIFVNGKRYKQQTYHILLEYQQDNFDQNNQGIQQEVQNIKKTSTELLIEKHTKCQKCWQQREQAIIKHSGNQYDFQGYKAIRLSQNSNPMQLKVCQQCKNLQDYLDHFYIKQTKKLGDYEQTVEKLKNYKIDQPGYNKQKFNQKIYLNQALSSKESPEKMIQHTESQKQNTIISSGYLNNFEKGQQQRDASQERNV